MGAYTYIAADFDHDEDAVNHLHYLKERGLITFLDAHEIQQSYDSSLACSIKKSLKHRLDNSYKFVLIVGNHTNTVSKGGCQFCDSYNSYLKYCAKGYSVDYRSFIQFECDNARNLGLDIVVLHKNIVVDRNLCPEAVRRTGSHYAVVCRGADGQFYWNDNAIIQAMR